MGRYPIWTYLVIAVTCWSSFRGFRDRAYANKLIFWPEAILAWKQYYRVVSSAFVHSDWIHLAVNMITLYLFGKNIELAFGAVTFLIVYFGAITGGSLLSVFIHRHHDYRAWGASGGVAGIVFAVIAVNPYGPIDMVLIPLGIPGWVFALLYFGFTFYQMHRQIDDMGHDAHLGGALAGLYIMAAFNPWTISAYPWWFGAMTLGTVAVLVYLVKNPMMLPMEGVNFTSSSRPRFSLKGLTRWIWPRKARAASKQVNLERETDLILQKISSQGVHTLTDREKELLKQASTKYQRRALREKPQSGFPF